MSKQTLKEQLERIKAKIVLRMKLTEKEKSIWILYGASRKEIFYERGQNY